MEESPVRRFSVLVRLMQFLGIFSYVWPNSPPDASPRQSFEETLDEAVKLRMNSWLTSKVKAFTMALGIVPLVLSVINVYYEGMTELYMTPLRIMKETAMSSVYVLQMGLFVLILYFLSTFVNHLVRDAVASTQTAELQLWRASAQVKDEAWCQQQMSQLLHLELRLRKVSLSVGYSRHGVQNPSYGCLAVLSTAHWAPQSLVDYHNVTTPHRDML
ncbi:hypothetical protein E2C01_026311 [Portunus trituberculatus]|uniref:Uncharacterized protein n=1 Tax=Portunus trituberculatus TaxID=210409 RepID=A0A5B7EIU0_PORTR|nr:hypothetical protein [Portunus trituberculatus]